MIFKIFILGLALISTSVNAEERASLDASPSFLGKLFGPQEDFTSLKKERRQIIAEAARLERDLKTLVSQEERLVVQLDDSSIEQAQLNSELLRIDTLLKESGEKNTTLQAKTRLSSDSFTDRFRREPGFLTSLKPEELRSRKATIEQRIKDITDRQGKLAANRDEQRKKRDELEFKQARLVELEDRIGVALSTGDKQYIYRTVVSLIFAAIVALLVFQFFKIVQDNEEIRKSIFTGDTGIQFITLFSIVIAVILFGILEILGANELSALLGGLSGYILGKSSPRQ